MRAPTIRQGGTPAHDGDVTRFVAPEVLNKGWYNPTRRIIFVNGMGNSGENHVESCNELSLMTGATVLGVFNNTSGFWSDLGQCIKDKLTLSTVQSQSMISFEDWNMVVDAAYRVERQRKPGLDKVDFVGQLIAGNKATHALYALLVGQGGTGTRVEIYCHSQGNLITSNALTAAALAQGKHVIAGMQVNSFGSPCRYWPPGIARVNNAFTFDGVSFLDLRMDLTSSKVGFKAAHGFMEYARHDGEFVVNRFRWGGWGMTFSLNEKALARFCVEQGDNTRRLNAIFERLKKAHPTDSDDVALEYVRLLSDARIARLKQHDPAFIDLLISLLKSGVTFGDERAAIDRLKAA
ncbi:hypothetical protein [Paracoccus tegillarcae]|uniref:Uncharacterized protein n=1 Tax=Paracoccus tegillarcae TaxID=1529068 RepID=A0A2K9ED49_9RHOB|nr:hypothetical protein [Paracoccus tegillarcae]AUH32850.1 hypothetical protein CUV01_05130 [Paracoccus tegillarcae]